MKKTILLIEDHQEIRENIAEILELAGYTVLTSQDGKEGVESALRHKPDLVICDIMMPVMDGYGVLHIFHSNEDLRSIPFIFLTAKSERSDFRKGMEMGADDYISKPFEKSELLSAVETRINKIEAIKKEFSRTEQGWQDFIHHAKKQIGLQDLINDRKILFYKKKKLIYSEGDDPYKLYFIKKGKVKVYLSNEEGKEHISDIYKGGDFFGYLAIIANTVHKENAETMEDSELIPIPKEDFLNLIFKDQQVANQFIKMLSGNISEKEKQLLDMAYNSVRKQTANALVFLQDKFKTDTGKADSLQISRDDIAAIAGTATESLVRTLGDFKSEKLIDIVDGKIIILNENKLKHLRN